MGRGTVAVGRPQERAALLLAALGTVLAPLNSTMMVVALPTIVEDLHMEVASAGWLITAYLFGMLLLQYPAGLLGDRLGRRLPVLAGFLGFGATAMAALAHSFPALLGFRMLQAVSAALVVPNVTAVVRSVVPAERRALAFGALGSVASGSAAAGPVLAGLLIHILGWPSIFTCNLAVVLPGLIVSWRVLGAEEGSSAGRAGAETAAARRGSGVAMPGADALAGREGAAAGDGAALPWARRVQWPPFLTANVGTAVANFGMYTAFVAVPLLLGTRPGWTAGATGLVLLAQSGATVVLAPVGGRWADRRGRREPLLAGFALLVLGLSLLAGHGASLVVLLLGLGAVGCASGLSASTLRTVANETVHVTLAGQAAAVNSASRYVGSITATLLLTHLSAAAGYRGLFLAEAAVALGMLALLPNIPAKRGASGRPAAEAPPASS